TTSPQIGGSFCLQLSTRPAELVGSPPDARQRVRHASGAPDRPKVGVWPGANDHAPHAADAQPGLPSLGSSAACSKSSSQGSEVSEASSGGAAPAWGAEP